MNFQIYLLVVLCLISRDFATCSLALQKHVVSPVVTSFSTFVSTALRTSVAMFYVCVTVLGIFSVFTLNLSSEDLSKKCLAKKKARVLIRVFDDVNYIPKFCYGCRTFNLHNAGNPENLRKSQMPTSFVNLTSKDL